MRTESTSRSAFVLQGTDDSAVRQLFDAKVRQSFSSWPGASLFFEGIGRSTLLRQGTPLTADQIRDLITRSLAVVRAMKR